MHRKAGHSRSAPLSITFTPFILMASGNSDDYESILLNHEFGGASLGNPSTWYLGLYTTEPTDSSAGVEVSGGAYARLAITNNTTNFPTTTTNEKNLGLSVAFPEATSGWGSITAFGLFVASTGGTPRFWGTITPQVINTGDVFRVPAGSAGLRIIRD